MKQHVKADQSTGKAEYKVQWGPCRAYVIKPQSAMKQHCTRLAEACTRPFRAILRAKRRLMHQCPVCGEPMAGLSQCPYAQAMMGLLPSASSAALGAILEGKS